VKLGAVLVVTFMAIIILMVAYSDIIDLDNDTEILQRKTYLNLANAVLLNEKLINVRSRTSRLHQIKSKNLLVNELELLNEEHGRILTIFDVLLEEVEQLKIRTYIEQAAMNYQQYTTLRDRDLIPKLIQMDSDSPEIGSEYIKQIPIQPQFESAINSAVYELWGEAQSIRVDSAKAGATYFWALLTVASFLLIIAYLSTLRTLFKISKSTRQIADGARRLHQGGFHQIPKSQVLELDELVKEFNKMGASITDTMGELSESEAMLRTLFDHTPNGILLVNDAGIIINTNQAIKEMFGYDKSDLFGQPVEILIPEQYHESHVVQRTAYTSNPKPKKMADGRELMGKNKNGQHTPVEISIVSVRYKNRNHVIASIVDITKRVQARDQLKLLLKRQQQISEKLAISNSDLERFAYICANDLQEPIRSIVAFSDLMESRLNQLSCNNDQKLKSYMAYIHDAALDSKKMIVDILKLYSIETDRGGLELIDLEDMLSTIRGVLLNDLATNNANIEWNLNPSCTKISAVRDQLWLVFINLINNSLKFNHEDQPHILITSEHSTVFRNGASVDAVLVKLLDNGIGIPDKQRESVFEIFRQLDKGADYSGRGLGLAICKKILDRHSGKILIGEHGDRGCCIEMYWPVTPILVPR